MTFKRRGNDPRRRRNRNRNVANVATAKNRCWTNSAPFGQLRIPSNAVPAIAADSVKATAMQTAPTVPMIRAGSGRRIEAMTRLMAASHRTTVPMRRAISADGPKVGRVRLPSRLSIRESASRCRRLAEWPGSRPPIRFRLDSRAAEGSVQPAPVTSSGRGQQDRPGGSQVAGHAPEPCAPPRGR